MSASFSLEGISDFLSIFQRLVKAIFVWQIIKYTNKCKVKLKFLLISIVYLKKNPKFFIIIIKKTNLKPTNLSSAESNCYAPVVTCVTWRDYRLSRMKGIKSSNNISLFCHFNTWVQQQCNTQKTCIKKDTPYFYTCKFFCSGTLTHTATGV